MSVAFNAIGKRVLSNEKVEPHLRWTGAEAEYRDLGARPASPHEVFVGQAFEIRNHELYERQAAHVADLLGRAPSATRPILGFGNWADAVDKWEHWATYGPRILVRRNNTLALMHRLAASGRLEFVTLDEGKGTVRPVETVRWNCRSDHALDRLMKAALNSDPRWYMSRPDTDAELPAYFSRFDIPIFVSQACLQSLRTYLDRHLELALSTAQDATPFDLMDVVIRDLASNDLNMGDPVASPRDEPAAATSAPNNDHVAWASDAAARKVAVRDARRDALNRLGAAAPKEEACRELLKAAMSAIGLEVKRGRPTGSKSYWNKEN